MKIDQPGHELDIAELDCVAGGLRGPIAISGLGLLRAIENITSNKFAPSIVASLKLPHLPLPLS